MTIEFSDERLEMRIDCHAGDHGALDRARVRNALDQCRPCGSISAERSQTLAEEFGPRLLGVEQRSQRQQDVGQCLGRLRPLGCEFEAPQRPGDVTAGRRTPRDEAEERALP